MYNVGNILEVSLHHLLLVIESIKDALIVWIKFFHDDPLYIQDASLHLWRHDRLLIARFTHLQMTATKVRIQWHEMRFLDYFWPA